MSAAPPGGLPPLDLRVRCADQSHTLRWTAGTLTAVDHPDVDRERALVALGGDRCRCLDVLDGWQAHSDDLDVLVLASRGAADVVPVQLAESGDADSGAGYVGVQSHRPMPAVYHGRYRPMRRARSGWYAYSPLGTDRDHAPTGMGVEALLQLDQGLAHRLVATVVATWAQRVDERDERVDAALPALQAALYGRALPAVRTWLADPHRPVELTMLETACRPYITAGDDAVIRLGLGFDWLRDVWVPGFATTFGRLCLTAESSAPTAWSLLTVGPDLDEPRVMTVSW